MVAGQSRQVSASLSALLVAIDHYRNRPAGGLTPDQLADELMELRHGCDLLELEFSRMASAFAASDEYEERGSVSAVDWIRHNCKMTSTAAADRVCLGDEMHKLRQSADAVNIGTIGFAHLTVMARTASALAGSRTAAPFDEVPLLEKAREISVGRLYHHCLHLRHALDAEGFAEQEKDNVEMRRLRLTAHEDGLVLIDGLLDSAGGAAVRTALEPLARLCGSDDNRNRERRLADALIELSTHALDSGRLPQQASQRTHLQVTATLETLRGLAGSPAGDMEFSLPISARTVQRLACDCSITRVLLAADSAVIDVGRAYRVVPGSTRKALNARDRWCRWPDCDRPASWSEAHHLLHWIDGGATDLTNLILLCYRHHVMAHEGGWQLVRTDDGRLLTIPPRPLRLSSLRAPHLVPAAAG